VKAKNFLEYLCEELEYRLFAGTACKGLMPLYKKMNRRIMHYVPAVNEKASLGILNGAYYADVSGIMVLELSKIYNIFHELTNFNLIYNVPLLILAYKDDDVQKVKRLFTGCKIPILEFDGLETLDKIHKKIVNNNIPGILIIGEGDLQ